MNAKSYWNRNLDTDNLSRPGGTAHSNLEESFAFAETPEFEWIRRRAGDPAGRTLLDIGGGIGLHSLLWARAGARVLVLDLAVERLRAIRALARRAGLEDRIACVAGRAEDLPFLTGRLDCVFTKSVLIHTELRHAAGEVHRVLRPGGRGLFIEPMNRNPIIRIYRGLFAPRAWRGMTRYFDAESLEILRRPFGELNWKGFYLLSAGAFFWQYAWRHPERFRKSLAFWRRRDRWMLETRPGLEPWCWFASIEVRK